MSVEAIVKSLVAMGGALLIIGAGLIFMSGTLAGSAALMVAAVALAVLAPTLAFLGTLKWSTIIKGLGAIALALGTLALVGALVAEPLALLGLALIPLALAFSVAAGGVFLFAKALALLGDSGGKGVTVMIAALTAFVAFLPTLVIQFIKGLLSIVEEVAKLAPKVIMALGVILDTIIAFVIENAPRLALAIGALVDAVVLVMATNAPKLIAAGYKLLNDILNGISQNIVQVTNKVAEIITKFLGALAAKAPQLTAAGANLLIKFLNGITAQIPKIVTTVTNMVVKFINALTQNIGKVTAAGQNLMLKLISSIAAFVPRLVQEGVKIIGNFISGLSQNVNKIVDKGANLVIKLIEGITSNMNKIANKGADAVIKFLHGLAETIRTKGPQLRAAGWDVADALIDGIYAGIAELGEKIVGKLKWLLRLLPQAAKKMLGIASPSKVFHEIGAQTVEGLANGIEDSGMKSRLVTAAGGIANLLPGKFRDILGIHSPSEVMKTIGKEVNQGFAQGLRGSVSDINGAFNDLNTKLREQINTSKQTIASEQDKLNDLLKEKKPDYTAINASKQAIIDETKILNASRSARSSLISGLADEHSRLINLTKKYEDVSKALEDATQALDEAKQKRDEAERSYAEKYAATPDVGPETTVEDYKKNLQDRITATASYAQTLQKLRELGLDDTTYKKLLEQGLEGKAFAEQLLAGGKPAIDGLNAMDTQLQTLAGNMAKTAASNLYQAGVNAAEGLVKGLKARKTSLKHAMEDLADSIVDAIKRKLKIKSPSEEFQEVGYYAVKGFAVGYNKGADEVTQAVVDSGGHAISTAKALFMRMPNFGDYVDKNPVITPVVDTTNLDKTKRVITDLTKIGPLTAAESFAQAEKISQAKEDFERQTGAQAGPTTNITYEQNNYSPDPISNIELYRQTNNQLSKLKGMVGVT